MFTKKIYSSDNNLRLLSKGIFFNLISIFYSKLSFLFNKVVVAKNKATAIATFAINIIIS